MNKVYFMVILLAILAVSGCIDQGEKPKQGGIQTFNTDGFGSFSMFLPYTVVPNDQSSGIVYHLASDVNEPKPIRSVTFLKRYGNKSFETAVDAMEKGASHTYQGTTENGKRAIHTFGADQGRQSSYIDYIADKDLIVQIWGNEKVEEKRSSEAILISGEEHEKMVNSFKFV